MSSPFNVQYCTTMRTGSFSVPSPTTLLVSIICIIRALFVPLEQTVFFSIFSHPSYRLFQETLPHCCILSFMVKCEGKEVNFVNRKIRYQHTDFCPYHNSPYSIFVTYAEIHSIGQASPGYKAMSYSCDCSDTCPYPSQDPYGRCPVFLTSPDEPR